MKKWFAYDTTLRDGLQEYGREISLNDAIKFAKKMDQMGFSWLEAGFANAGENQLERIRTLANLKLENTKIAAFGRTRGKNEKTTTAKDLCAILGSKAQVATLVGKARLRDVTNSLQTDSRTNLKMISESILFMKDKGLEVVFDAEHFFDGMDDDREYTLQVLNTAHDAGADWIVLCDTNGGSSIGVIKSYIHLAKEVVPISKLGFHGHNDRGRAVINSEVAFENGVTHIQGTINGFGERCGNTDLCQLLPNLYFDHNATCLKDEKSLKNLTSLSIETSEYLNADQRSNHPWVGSRAGYTEAGMHTSGILRDKSSYIHADLSMIGNNLSFGLSEQSGKSSLAIKASELGFALSKEQLQKVNDAHTAKINDGYCFAGADASLLLLINKEINQNQELPKLNHWQINTHHKDQSSQTEATVSLDYISKTFHEAGIGNGPVDALNDALQKIVRKVFPNLKNYHLSDYRVKIINPNAATAAKVRVLIEFSDRKDIWTTVGVHENIIEASWIALKDGIDYMRLKNSRSTSTF